ncbi:MAG: hypothetical protein GY906_40280 [bacterium]|nr:hypothetical protein [bacterium]
MSNTYDNEAVRNLTLRRESIYDLMEAAPGITAAWERGGLMAMGSETDANAYKLDGVAIDSRSQGVAWLVPNTDIIDEVEVIALGASAEYGHVPGGVFNVITRQGSNSFHGDVNLYIQTDGLTGRNTDDEYDHGHPYHRDKFLDYRSFTIVGLATYFPEFFDTLTALDERTALNLLRSLVIFRELSEGLFRPDEREAQVSKYPGMAPYFNVVSLLDCVRMMDRDLRFRESVWSVRIMRHERPLKNLLGSIAL